MRGPGDNDLICELCLTSPEFVTKFNNITICKDCISIARDKSEELKDDLHIIRRAWLLCIKPIVYTIVCGQTDVKSAATWTNQVEDCQICSRMSVSSIYMSIYNDELGMFLAEAVCDQCDSDITAIADVLRADTIYKIAICEWLGVGVADLHAYLKTVFKLVMAHELAQR